MIFSKKLFQSSKLKAPTSLSNETWQKRRSSFAALSTETWQMRRWSFELRALKQHSRISPQVG